MQWPLCTSKPSCLYSHACSIISNTHEEVFDLQDTLLRHGAHIEGNVGQGVSTSGVGKTRAGTCGARPSHTNDPFRSPNPTKSRYHCGHAEVS